MKTVVITGATGAIGRALIKIAVEAGYEVLTVVHRDSARAGELEKHPHCHVLRLNLDEYDRGIEELEKQRVSPREPSGGSCRFAVGGAPPTPQQVVELFRRVFTFAALVEES